jgi:hypothetical protein
VASATLYVPLLQVQLRSGSRAALVGQPHWETEEAPAREYWELGQVMV